MATKSPFKSMLQVFGVQVQVLVPSSSAKQWKHLDSLQEVVPSRQPSYHQDCLAQSMCQPLMSVPSLVASKWEMKYMEFSNEVIYLKWQSTQKNLCYAQNKTIES